jgi:RNA recognition motif-containing protein
MKLIVLNLPRDLSEQSLALLFKKIGEIRSCILIIDKYTGISKGFGFVEMTLDHEGEIAIKELHGTKVGKNKIRVKQSTDQL